MQIRCAMAGLILLAASAWVSAHPIEDFLAIQDGKFIDAEGRQILLRGVNMGDKNPARNYQSWHGPEEFAAMRAWGFNCVRLLIFWDGVEPEPGQYNDAYLAEVDKRIAWAKEHGIYVILDMHQDLYCHQFGGDGAPKWATLDDGLPHLHKQGAPWSMAYQTSPAVQRAFDHFWDNSPGPGGIGIQDRFALAWRHVAERYANESAVVGYDILNEPFPGSVTRDAVKRVLAGLCLLLLTDSNAPPLSGIFGGDEGQLQLLAWLSDIGIYRRLVDSVEDIVHRFENEKLMPMYDRVWRAIREVDEKHILFIEPCVYSNVGVRSIVRPPVGRDGAPETLVAYAPHAYDIVTDTPLVDQASDERLGFIFERLGETAEHIGPMIIGEWGAYYGSQKVLPAARVVVRQFEKALCGDTYWDYHRGLEQGVFFEVLHRPYPVAVSGDLLEYRLDTESGTFTCVWREGAAVAASTRIYLPDRWYPEGYTLRLSPENSPHTTTVIQGNNLWIDIPPLPAPGERRLEITPK